MDLQRIPWGKICIYFVEIIFIVNLVFLDIVIITSLNKPPQAAVTQATPTPMPTANPTATSPLPVTVTPTPQNTPTPVIIYQPAPATNTVKEYFVPFGGGQAASTSWANVPGLQAYVDSSNYPNIKQVVFEASVQIPTGNQTASVQLFNQTAGHPVWFSQVSLSGGTPQFLISQPITLDNGNNLYQVQMTTQLGFQTIITQARLHIYLQ